MKRLTAQILGMYLGCEVQVRTATSLFFGRLIGVNKEDYWNAVLKDTVQVLIDETFFYYHLPQIKLILRPLASMTEEDAKELWKEMDWATNWTPEFQLRSFARMLDGDFDHRINLKEAFKLANFLRSKGYDCDGLLESGLAIEKQ